MAYATENGVSSADMSADPAWIKISDEQYAQALAGMSAGKQVSIDGGFALVDPPKPEDPPAPKPEPPTADELASAARAKRDRLLSESDWIVTRSIETAADTPPEWLSYRQALRDVPEQAGFPQAIDWPTAPQFV